MSKLAFYGRPWVIFDAKNRLHRKWFAEFNRTFSWGHCPVRFVVNEEAGDLITQIQRELIAFYVNKEFTSARENPVVKKPQKKK